MALILVFFIIWDNVSLDFCVFEIFMFFLYNVWVWNIIGVKDEVEFGGEAEVLIVVGELLFVGFKFFGVVVDFCFNDKFLFLDIDNYIVFIKASIGFLVYFVV